MNAIRLAVTIVTLCLGTGAVAQDGPEDAGIAPQPLNKALEEFAKQTGLQVIYVTELAEGKETPGAEPNLSDTETLDQLLASTGLEYEFLNNETVTVQPAKPGGDSDSGNGRKTPSTRLMAHAPEAMQKSQESANASSQSQPSEKFAEPVERKMEEIVVTGTNIRGVDNIGATSIIFTRQEIVETGYSTVEELFASLPQNLDQITDDGAFAQGADDIAGANVYGATSISLRGLGPGSTLVLLNGKRRPGNINGRAFDVSAIPLSMIERVEIVTGGRSAIYGSDAVAGVVNIVTLTELNGVVSNVYYGESAAGGERVNFSQTFGRDFDKSGFVVGYDYRKDRPLDLTATGVSRAPSVIGITPLPDLWHLRSAAEQHSVLFAGHYDPNEKAKFYADAQFAKNEYEQRLGYNFLGLFDATQFINVSTDQYSAVGGVRFDVGNSWQIDASIEHGEVNNSVVSFELDVPPSSDTRDDAKLSSFAVVADGPIGSVAGRSISAAIGTDFRKESYERTRISLPSSTKQSRENIDRDVWSLFGELYIPLFDKDGRRLDVSIAGRYDDYSDIGGSFNPQFGVEWQPTRWLTLRGSFATAFRAPDLFTLDLATQVVVENVPDPLNPAGTTTLFSEFGGNPGLQPEEADTWTVGVYLEPSERTKVSLSYFSISYENRIDQPGINASLGLVDENLYPDLINRSATAADLDEVFGRMTDFFNQTATSFDPVTDDPFAVFPGLAIFDNRRTNIAIEELSGLDLQASTTFASSVGDWSIGFNGTYYLDFERNITPVAPAVDRLNQPGRPVDLKLRAYGGWARDAWSINTYVNYVDGYPDTSIDPFSGTVDPLAEIDSWTTVDLILRFRTPEIENSNGILDGITVTLALQNAFDEDPPEFTNNWFGLGYDSANADALGRFISLAVTKAW